MDDMIAKSRTEEEHLINLWKLFERLRKYQLRLNPAKCTFGVKLGKLFGFIVSQKGIEVDPDKVKAILLMLERGNGKRERVVYYMTVLDESMGCMLGQHDDSGKRERVV